MLLVLAIALVIGFFMGAAGVGGILLIVPLTLIAGVEIHQASATLLLTFLFTGLYGAWLFHRRGTIDWRVSIVVSVGAMAFGFLGARANALVDAATLSIVIAAVIIFAGAYVLLPVTAAAAHGPGSRSASGTVTLLVIGAVSGFGAGISGAGGPLFSVPIMLVAGFPPLTAIGTGMIMQIVAATSGSIGNLIYGSIDFTYAFWLTVCELIGVYAGVRFSHAARAEVLRRMAGWICVVAGAGMLWKAL